MTPAATDEPPVTAQAAATAAVRDAVWALARAAAITAAEWRRRHADGASDGMDDEDDDESEPRDEGRDAEDDDAGTPNDAEAPEAARLDDGAGVVAGPAAGAVAGARRVRVVVAGEPGSARASRRTVVVPVNIMRGGELGNPFPMGAGGRASEWRAACVDLHRRWLMAGDVPAEEMSMPDGAAVPHRLRPQRREARLTGNIAMQALVSRIDAVWQMCTGT